MTKCPFYPVALLHLALLSGLESTDVIMSWAEMDLVRVASEWLAYSVTYQQSERDIDDQAVVASVTDLSPTIEDESMLTGGVASHCRYPRRWHPSKLTTGPGVTSNVGA